MSSGRRATRPVRQLSLQQPAPRRQHVRRQRSAEDDCGRSPQIYANPIARGRSAANATEKPKVRVAWGDDDRRGRDGVAQVEVVARQIPSRSRPVAGRSCRTYAAAEKASILCSRQELAERLRLAWKHRERNKANIDIFLAHGVATEERCDSRLSTATPLSRRELDSVRNGRGAARRNPAASGDAGDRREEAREENDNEDGEPCGRKLETACRPMENDLSRGGTEEAAGNVKREERDNEKSVTNLDIEEVESTKKTRINIDCANLRLATTADRSTAGSSKEAADADSARSNADFSLARQKRASFHSGTNRAFLVPMATAPEARGKIASRSIENRCASSADRTARSPIDKGAALARSPSTASLERAKRTSSAPPQRRSALAAGTRVQVNVVIDAPGLAEDRSIACEKMQDAGGDTVEKCEEGAAKMSRGERSVRSAPLKRRSRSARRRFLASSGLSKDEDRGGKGRGKLAFVDPKTSDVVTMVSLVSSADSDSDVENSPGDDKLISELRSKLPTTPIIKTSINPNPPGTARKPIKSVSFQRDSFDEEPREEKRVAGNLVLQLPRFNGLAVNVAQDLNEDSRTTVLDGAAVTVPVLAVEPALIPQDNAERPAPPEAPLTDREKRCLAVPIGDLRDKKRKLLRTRSTPSRAPIRVAERTSDAPMEIKEQRMPLAIPRINLVAIPTPSIGTPLSKVKQFPKETSPARETPAEVMLPSEPHFQTTKEKECWHLYRRMCDKGVCVSFDTVLRGMLTPTEYRLRQKECSQDLP